MGGGRACGRRTSGRARSPMLFAHSWQMLLPACVAVVLAHLAGTTGAHVQVCEGFGRSIRAPFRRLFLPRPVLGVIRLRGGAHRHVSSAWKNASLAGTAEHQSNRNGQAPDRRRGGPAHSRLLGLGTVDGGSEHDRGRELVEGERYAYLRRSGRALAVKFVSWSSVTTCQPLRCVISWNGKRKAVDPDLLRPLTEIAHISTSKKPGSPVKASKSSNSASATAYATARKTYTPLSSPSASPCASPLKVCSRPQESNEVSASPISLDPRRGAVPCPRRKPRHQAVVERKFGAPSLCAAIRGGSCEASSSSGWVSASDGVGVMAGRKKETRAAVPEMASADVSSASSWETALAHLQFQDDVAEGAEDPGADATASGHQESKVDGESSHVEPQDARHSDGGIAPAHNEPAQDALEQDQPAQDEADDVRQQLKTRLLKTLHRRRDEEGRKVAKGMRGIWSSAIGGAHDVPGNVTPNSVTADECPQRSKKDSGGGKSTRVTGSVRSKVVSAPNAERGAEDEPKGRRSAAKSKSRKNRGDAGAAASQVCEVAGPTVGWYPRSEGNGGACAGDSPASSPQVASADAAIPMPADTNTSVANMSVAANTSVSASASRAVAAADHDRLEALFNRHREHGRRNVCTLVVDGNPVALKRPRHRFGGHTYDPNYRDKKRFVKECQQQLPSEPLQGAIALSMLFELPRAKFHFSTAKKTLGHRKENAPELPIKVPDLDNLVKFVLDALNEHLFVDDKQICEINARKCYRDIAGAGRTVIHVCHL